MARKKVAVAEITKQIQKLLKEDKLIIGQRNTLRSLTRGKVDKIFLASNCPKEVEEEIKYYAGLSDVEVIKLDKNNEELGIICRKPFFISVIGVVKNA